MELQQNVGGRDRRARATLAVLLAGLGAYALLRGRTNLGGVAVLAAVGFGFNAVTCFCGVNEVLGVDTTD
jgi:hypothetical protein